MHRFFGFASVVSLTLVLAVATAHGDDADEKAGEAITKRTIPRPIWLLVDAKTQEKIRVGNRGIKNSKKPDVPKRVEIPRESVGMKTLRDAMQKKDQNRERFPASAKTLATYNRDFTVKSVSMILADDTVIECRALVRADDAQIVVLDKDIIMALTIEAASDQGSETWYCYASVYEAPVAPSADLVTQKKVLKGLQGAWRIASSQHTGDVFLFEQDPTGLKVVVTGDTLTYYSRDERGKYEGRMQLDPVTKALDWSPAYSGIGPLTGATVPFRGIYELKDGEFKICFHDTKWERPKSFAFSEGWLLNLKRQEP